MLAHSESQNGGPGGHSNDRIWTKGDLLAGLFTGLVSFAVYAWTAAPNVTLLDSGEFIVAAQHFGVPHPTGYPLWTLLAWLFQLLPLGNAAWEINIFSGFCGGLAVGLTTALTRSSLRWLMQEALDQWQGLLTIVSVTCGLLFAFSFSMWSQATIAEVYTLHALMIGAYLTALYAWLRRPDRLGLLLLAFFLIALSFGNHHLSVAMAPLPFLAVLLVRRGMFWDLVLASLLTVLLAYLGFAILSADPLVLKTAIRFFYAVMLGFLVLVVVRRFQIEWRLVAYLPFVVALGLLPYAYMPLASSTNPPMNWAYTRTPAGFFFSFNRSQYGGSLSQQSLRSLGRLMGSAGEQPAPPPGNDPHAVSLYTSLQEWAGFFWLQLGRSFTPIGILGYFGALFVILRLKDVARRTWIYLAEVGFVLAAILQPIADGAGIDVGGWWLQMPYHTYTNLIFALLAALGIALGCAKLFGRFPRLAWLRFLLLLLPIMPLMLNEAGSSQRGRWFGWQFGHDMLKDLPKGSVFFGGTDPGRFVPTYMILGESTQPARLKRDPDFDRRDLYIITQNGVGEPLYRKYLADHYGPDRPAPKNAFERWLGRGEAYPATPLVFPTEEEIREAVEKEIAEATKDGGMPDSALGHSVVTRLIWEKNKDLHEFFVEESFPLEWSYDYAVPNGLSYRISKEPLKEIPADVVRKDTEFWNAYIESLLRNPDFEKDFDAQRSFSKLRTTAGNIYKYRKMLKEAELAYRQALILWPGNPESLNAMNGILWDRGDYDGVIKILEPANAGDPNNFPLWRMRAFAEKRKELEGDIKGLKEDLAKNPRDKEKTTKLLDIYYNTGETNQTSELLGQAVETFQDDPDFLRTAVQYGEMNALAAQELAAAKKLVAVESNATTNAGNDYLLLARAAFKNNDKTNFYSAARTAIQKGGLPVREAIFKHPLFEPWRKDEEFQKLQSPVPEKK
ncbi:MAG: protein O-mannosyl-transferase family [Terrimicrobiaceae bacterium]